MQITCGQCRRISDFSGERPRFCGHCGGKHAAHPDSQTGTLPPAFDPNETAHFAASASRASDDVPEVVGGFRLVRRLGGGGMGSVYEAEDPASGRHVALKLILPEYAESVDAVERFRQEGRLASSLSHPRCVFVLAADEADGRPYIVMELMPGSTLDDLIREKGPLAPLDALAKILDVIDGLDEAHRHGLVHRDVKPSNCFLEADGRVKVGDFGLSKSLAGDSKLTRTGTFMGTPLYAAPEQIKTEAIDAQSDLYSVAATLYFLLTGRAPFQSDDAMATLARIVSDDAPPMRSIRPDLPAALDKVVLRGLARDRKRRWRDLDEFRLALLPFLPVAPSLGGMSLRLGAYLIDCVLLWVVMAVVGMVLVVPAARAGLFAGLPAPLQPLVQYLLYAAVWLMYTGVLEGGWGWTVGKRLLRLRVGTVAGDAPPGVVRGLLRGGFFYFLLNLWYYVLPFALYANLFAVPVLQPGVQPTQAEGLALMALGCSSFVWLCIAVALLVGTMRARNGYRGMHELVSGTRTYRLGWHRASKRQAIRGRDFRVEESHPEGVPERVGPYRIRGALRWAEGERILLGGDPQLRRDVWVWLRPPSDAPLDADQRDINRNTRVRWLACGLEAGRRWDAFLAAPGARLPEVVASGGALSWAEARPLLESLADELALSCADGTLPDGLTVDHVWMRPDGSVQLLPAYSTGVADEGQALELLRRVAVTALEGAPPGDALPDFVRAPVPVHVTPILGRMLGGRNAYATPGDFSADVEATRDRSVAVSRARRFGHLCLMVALLNIPFFGLMLFLGVPLIGLLEQCNSPNTREPVRELEAGYAVALFCPLFWVVWAFVFRGGYAFWRGGIALRRRDGRKATRLQCAFRALLVWGPVAGVLALALASARHSPESPALYFGVWGVAVLLLFAFAFLAIRSPSRGPHDRIAGTVLVPS